jgi:hypothetical protein
MTTYQFFHLVNTLQDILIRQDWYNNGNRENVLSMGLGELITEVTKLPEGENTVRIIYHTVF